MPRLVWLWHGAAAPLWLGFFPVQQEFIWGLAVCIVLVVLCEGLPSFSFLFSYYKSYILISKALFFICQYKIHFGELQLFNLVGYAVAVAKLL